MKLMILTLFFSFSAFAQTQLEKDVQFLSDWGHNAGSSIEAYNQQYFNLSAAAVSAYKNAVDYGHCYSSDIVVVEYDKINTDEKLAQATKDFLEPYKSDQEIPATIVAQIQEATLRVLTAKENLATVYVGYNKRDFPEYCLFHNFYVYRNDGKHVILRFNHTD